jgi:hypothetical protein
MQYCDQVFDRLSSLKYSPSKRTIVPPNHGYIPNFQPKDPLIQKRISSVNSEMEGDAIMSNAPHTGQHFYFVKLKSYFHFGICSAAAEISIDVSCSSLVAYRRARTQISCLLQPIRAAIAPGNPWFTLVLWRLRFSSGSGPRTFAVEHI